MTLHEINALPERVRRYIHDLSTRTDPAGEVQELFSRREQVRALELLSAQADKKLATIINLVSGRTGYGLGLKGDAVDPAMQLARKIYDVFYPPKS